jgi:hypothetical protein
MNELYQIYYKDEQKEKLLPFAIPYFNSRLTIFFESAVISEVVPTATGEKVGVCSWKLANKMRKRMAGPNLRPMLTVEALNSDYQVLSLTRNSKKHQMLAHLYQWHPKSKEAMALLWEKLGLKLPGEAKTPIYQNHFIAKREIYQDYVNNFLKPAMEVIKTDERINNLMLQPSGYGKLSKEADMKSVKEKLGLDDYPLCPFILERCPSLFFQLKNVQITYL